MIDLTLWKLMCDRHFLDKFVAIHAIKRFKQRIVISKRYTLRELYIYSLYGTDYKGRKSSPSGSRFLGPDSVVLNFFAPGPFIFSMNFFNSKLSFGLQIRDDFIRSFVSDNQHTLRIFSQSWIRLYNNQVRIGSCSYAQWLLTKGRKCFFEPGLSDTMCFWEFITRMKYFRDRYQSRHIFGNAFKITRRSNNGPVLFTVGNPDCHANAFSKKNVCLGNSGSWSLFPSSLFFPWQ